MKNGHLLMCFVGILSCCAVGCGSSDDDKSQSSDCVQGVVRCADDGQATEVCDGGVWRVQETCDAGCANNACTDSPPTPNPCAGKALDEPCNADGTKTCQAVEGNDDWVCQDKVIPPVVDENPCAGKALDEPCNADGTKTCQAVEGNDDWVCQDKALPPVDETTCTAAQEGETRCNADRTAVESCQNGAWQSTSCGVSESTQTSCFALTQGAACKTPCPEGVTVGEPAQVCEGSEGAFQSVTIACEQDVSNHAYLVSRQILPCHSQCTDGQCDYVNPCEGQPDSNGGPTCILLYGQGYYAACKDEKLEYPNDSYACGENDTSNIVGTGCVAGYDDRSVCGCTQDSECRGGFQCRVLGWNPDFPSDGNYCYDPS